MFARVFACCFAFIALVLFAFDGASLVWAGTGEALLCLTSAEFGTGLFFGLSRWASCG